MNKIEINKTYDYNKFKYIKGNRQVKKNHIAKLKESMKKKFFVSPIMVNEKMEILDGQHRFTASKELKLPIYFYITSNLGFEDIINLNKTQKSWNNADYLNHYCELGNKEYIKFRDFIKENEITIQNALVFLGYHLNLGGSSKGIHYFKTGQFTWKDLDERKIMLFIYFYSEIKNLFPFGTQRAFTIALTKTYNNPKINHERLFDNIRKYYYLIEERNKVKDYLFLIQRVYNHNEKELVNIDEDLLK